jgi:hypothetical protein
MSESITAYLKRIASKGGSSKSTRKTAASRENARKAREKRAANLNRQNNNANKSE